MSKELSIDSFEITWRNGAYYVSIPNYQGGKVYTADYVDGLLASAQGARQPCGCGVVCQDLGKEAGCRYMQPSRRDLRKLVDLVYQHAADCVPMTLTADKLIDEVFGPAEAPEHTEGSR